jgi:hypothetical protein
MKQQKCKKKDYHSDLPAYIWVPISENFLHPKTVGNPPSNIKISTRYAYVEVNPEYYEKINVVNYENS